MLHQKPLIYYPKSSCQGKGKSRRREGASGQRSQPAGLISQKDGVCWERERSSHEKSIPAYEESAGTGAKKADREKLGGGGEEKDALEGGRKGGMGGEGKGT